MMQTQADADALAHSKATGAVFILFGGAQCQVCQTLRPQLEAMLERDFPAMQGVYVDCAASPALCAQHGVYSLPVVQAFIEGMKVAEVARAFGMQQLKQQLERPYAIWREGRTKG